MEMVIRGSNQVAFDLHALIVGEAALSPMELPEGQIKEIARSMETTFNASSDTVCTKSEARGALEYLKGRMLTVRFHEGNREIVVPLAFDKYDNGSLLAGGQQVMGFPIHRLSAVTVGNGRAQKFTFGSPTGSKTSSLVMTPGGHNNVPNPVVATQRNLMDGYSVVQRKLTTGYRVPVKGSGIPTITDVFVPLKGQVISVEWVGAPTADPAWRGLTGWLLVDFVEGDATCFKIGGPGWSVEVKNLVGWRVGARGIVLDAAGADGNTVAAVNLQLIV